MIVAQADQNPPQPWAREVRTPSTWASASPLSCRTDSCMQGWIDIVEFAPRGFKLDRPAVPAYRLRLTALAKSIASDIEASSS